MIQVLVIKAPNIFVNRGGEKKIFQCPHCNAHNSYYTSGLNNCRKCRKMLPNICALMENKYYRIKWHRGMYK